MANWKYHLNLKDILNNYNTEKYPMQDFYDKVNTAMIKDLLKQFEAVPFMKERFEGSFKKVKTVGEFNHELDKVYAYADVNRIWMGTI